MGAGDEFDNTNNAPVPPHERTWRHPAEVNDALRQEISLRATPPPIGRRAAALVAFVSIVASATLMLVTVQKGISEPVAEPADVTTTSVAKGSLPPGTVMAVRAYGDYYVVPSSEVHGRRTDVRAGLKGPVVADVITQIVEKGITVVRLRGTGTLSIGAVSPSGTPGEPATFTAVDRSGQEFTASISIDSRMTGTSPPDNDKWFPLDVDGVIDGVATLLADGNPYAIAVRHNHVHSGITLADLASIVSAATGARDG